MAFWHQWKFYNMLYFFRMQFKKKNFNICFDQIKKKTKVQK